MIKEVRKTVVKKIQNYRRFKIKLIFFENPIIAKIIILSNNITNMTENQA